jgi:glycosyltransferase involved in cell wall biosynthesis
MSSVPQTQKPTIKILSLVEATNINAVAKNVLAFYRSAQELSAAPVEMPRVEACIATFARQLNAHSPNEFVMTARKLGVNVEIIPERRRFDLNVLPALRSIVERHRPDVVVTHSIKSHFLFWRSRLCTEFPWVAFHHGYTTTDLKMRVYNHLDRWSLPAADGVVTVCHAFARELARNTRLPVENISVQHNSIRPPQSLSAADDAQSVRSKLGIASDELVVLAVGRLSREKAHSDLLTAFLHLRENSNLRCRLVIVGDGPERAKLEAYAASIGINEDVIFTGQESQIQFFYSAADIFVLPSHSEGSPNVLLEAMAAKVPIVATNVGGVPEIVQDNETALLVPAKEPRSMAAAIARILVDESLAHRLAANAATLISSRHTPEQYVQSLVRIYQQAIDSHRSR